MLCFLMTPVLGKSGCCSSHGGVCGSQCCDGTNMPIKCEDSAMYLDNPGVVKYLAANLPPPKEKNFFEKVDLLGWIMIIGIGGGVVVWISEKLKKVNVSGVTSSDAHEAQNEIHKNEEIQSVKKENAPELLVSHMNKKVVNITEPTEVKIIKILQQSSGPLKAKELVKLLNKQRNKSGSVYTKKSINPILYSGLKGKVIKDDEDQWGLV